MLALLLLFALGLATLICKGREKEVPITMIPSEVSGLERIGEVSAEVTKLFGGQKELRKKARIKLLKEAKKMEADIIFLTTDNFMPLPINKVHIEGVAYRKIERAKE